MREPLMPARMVPNPAGITRLRTLVQAANLDESDKRGPLLIEMSREHVRQVTKAYTTEGAASGAAWPKLAPGYAAWKSKRFPGRKILVRTGETRERFTKPMHPGFFRRFLRPWRYQFGAVSEVQAAHESGVGSPGQRLPVRSILRKTPADIAAFQTVLVQFCVKRLRQVYRHA